MSRPTFERGSKACISCPKNRNSKSDCLGYGYLRHVNSRFHSKPMTSLCCLQVHANALHRRHKVVEYGRAIDKPRLTDVQECSRSSWQAPSRMANWCQNTKSRQRSSDLTSQLHNVRASVMSPKKLSPERVGQANCDQDLPEAATNSTEAARMSSTLTND